MKRMIGTHICRLISHPGIASRIELRIANAESDNGISATSEHSQPDILAGAKIQNHVALSVFRRKVLVCVIFDKGRDLLAVSCAVRCFEDLL